MDILKTALEWAKAEIFSSTFFIVFGVLFAITSLGFWQFGKTEIAKLFRFPTLIAGILLLAIGVGIFYANKTRIKSFAIAYQRNPTEFVKSEITRTEKTMREYNAIVFKIIPLIIITFSLIILFIDQPIWRAISITIIAMMVVILLVDSNANSRIENYRKQLELVDE